TLLGFEVCLQIAAFLVIQPLGACWPFVDEFPPDECPYDGGYPLDDEHPAPAQGIDEVARKHRHPQYGGGIAQNEEGVGARALLFGKPLAEEDEHGRHNGTLHD